MNKKHLKFLLIHEAIDEIKNTLMMRSELKIRNEIMPHLDRIGGFDIKGFLELLIRILYVTVRL